MDAFIVIAFCIDIPVSSVNPYHTPRSVAYALSLQCLHIYVLKTNRFLVLKELISYLLLISF